MGVHRQNLAGRCRIGGKKFSTFSKTNQISYDVKEYAKGIERRFGIDTGNDDPEVHPPRICSTCYKCVTRHVSGLSSGGCGRVLWREHDDSYCATCDDVPALGRPKKASKQPGQRHTTPQALTTTMTTRCQDIRKQDFLDKATDISHPTISPDMIPTQAVSDEFNCEVCNNIASKPVMSACCQNMYCAGCAWQAMETDLVCKDCKKLIVASSMQAIPKLVERIMKNIIVRCCSCKQCVQLGLYSSHLDECPRQGRSTPPPRAPVTGQSTIDELLQVTPTKPLTDTMEKATTFLMSAKAQQDSSGSMVQLKTGGREQTWVKVTKGRGAESERTARRQLKELQEVATIVTGSEERTEALEAVKLRHLAKERRMALLKDAGIVPKSLEAGKLLAMKADLSLPWHSFRSLRRWLTEFNMCLASEGSMRQAMADQLPFDLTAEYVPLQTKSGIKGRPCIIIKDLCGMVEHFYYANKKLGNLTWHGLPESEIWVKIGGDHGGKSFKLSFQLVNVSNPNSPLNTVPFIVFQAKDTPANLATMLLPYAEQVKQLQSSQIDGKAVRLTLFGDYEFQTHVYGLSGASAVHPCLKCCITKADMQLAPENRQTSPEKRTLKTLEWNFQQFTAAGSKLAKAREFNNVIRPALLPIDVVNACTPALHLDLGIFPYIMSCYEADLRELDSKLAVALAPSHTSQQLQDAAPEWLAHLQTLNEIQQREKEMEAANQQIKLHEAQVSLDKLVTSL